MRSQSFWAWLCKVETRITDGEIFYFVSKDMCV